MTARLIVFWLVSAVAGLLLVTAVVHRQEANWPLRQFVATAGTIADAWALRFDNDLEPGLPLDAMPGLVDGLAPLVNAKTGITGAAIISTNGKPVVQTGKTPFLGISAGEAEALFGSVPKLLGQFRAPPRIATAGGSIYVPLYDWTGLTRGVLVLAQDIRPAPLSVPWRECLGLVAMACLLAVVPLSRIVWRRLPIILAGLLGLVIFATALPRVPLWAHVAPDLLAHELAEAACIALAAAFAFRDLAFVREAVRSPSRNRLGAPPGGPARLLAGCCLAVPWPSLLEGAGTGAPWLCILAQVIGIMLGAKIAVVAVERYGWRAAGLPGAIAGILGSGLLILAGHPAITLAAWALPGFGGGLVMAALRTPGSLAGNKRERVARFLQGFKGPAFGLVLAFAVNDAAGAMAAAVLSFVFWGAMGLVIAARPNDRTAPLRFILRQPVGGAALVPQAMPLAVAQMLLPRASFPFGKLFLR